MSWSSRRQFAYASVVLAVLLVVAAAAAFFFLYSAPSCFDGKQNGIEVGVDCGGACSAVCVLEVAPLVVKWSRAFPVTPQNYSAVAYIENPNSTAGVQSISYRFEFFDKDNTLIGERTGAAYITPGTLTPVFESGINTGKNVPVRTFFEFTEEPSWSKAAPTQSILTVKSRSLSGVETRPRLDSTLHNNSSVIEFQDIDVVAVIFGADGNAIAASRTIVPLMSPGATEDIVFTWPLAFGKRIERCTAPSDIALLIDTSGSMNDDGGEPEQPIQDAKLSALSFVERLSEKDRVGIVSFATKAVLSHPLSLNHSVVGEAVSALFILPEEESGRTNIGDAVAVAFEEFSSFPRKEEEGVKARKVIVLLTDGKANAPEDPGGEPFALLQVEEAKAGGVTFFTIGLGDKVNAEFLSSIASSPENYFQAVTSGDLDGIYRSVSEAICERGPAVIDIIPRTRDVFKLAQ